MVEHNNDCKRNMECERGYDFIIESEYTEVVTRRCSIKWCF